MRQLGLILFAAFVAIRVSAATEPDFARELRLADEIIDSILDGDAQWLSDGEREFLSIYTEAETSSAAVLILHGRGFHPDWPDAINPLRVGLSEKGFSTLSLQMPVLEKSAKYYDYVPLFPYAYPRIEAGIQYLREQGHRRVILLAHSCGVHMAMSWLAQQRQADIDAFIGLGMGATDYRQPMAQPFPLDRLNFPVLDLYGSLDYPAVRKNANRRLDAINSAGNPYSRQRTLKGADHYFTDKPEPLVTAVADWLATLVFKQ
ncbi:MAG: pimeloyl-ACP methyl ester carboxylesterase [Planctomycetota bacterium]|jgi:pimeloyl-ACP methyl ester carboxylesterase